MRFLPYGKQIHSNRTLNEIARSLTVILVPIFSVFEVGVGLKIGVPGSRTYQITYTRFFAFFFLTERKYRLIEPCIR